MWRLIQPYLTRWLILPLWATITRSPYLDYYQKIRASQNQSGAQVKLEQFKQLKKILIHAYETTTYYKRCFDTAGFSPYRLMDFQDLTQIPILTKATVRANFDDLRSQKYPENSLLKRATGGSTGTPMQFYVTKKREIFHAATIALNYEWAGLRLGERLAMLWGSPFETSKYENIRGKMENILLGRCFLSTFVLSNAILEKYLIILKRFRPKVLLGYTSSLLAFAQFIEKKKLVPPELTSVMSGAESLHEHQREYLEQVFRCPVFNRYGGRDSGAVAAECPEQRNMHINSNLVYAEISPEGHILITDLWNDGMPFIRYDTEDQGIISPVLCSCGRGTPCLQKIEGRVHDLLLKPNGEWVPGEFFPHLFKDVRGIKQFQVIQDEVTTLTLRLVKDEGLFTEKDIEYLRSHILEYFGDIKLHFEYVHELHSLPSGKYRFTICNIPKTTTPIAVSKIKTL